MDAVFYFSFYEPDHGDNEPTVRHLSFYITHANRPWNEVENDMYEFEEQFEQKYGMHNWLRSPSNGIDLFRYESYEVKEHQHDELMERWRQAFLRLSPGCAVSEVFALGIDDTKMSSAHIFQYVKDTFEQQQAQQLRDTLAAHIITPASTAAAKKI